MYVEHGLAKARHIGKEIAAVEGQSRMHPRIVLGQFLPEIQPLLEIRTSRGELTAHRKIPAPRATAMTHVDPLLRVLRQLKEGAGQLKQRVDRPGLDVMACDVKEPELTRRVVDARSHTFMRDGGHINHGNARQGVREWHTRHDNAGQSEGVARTWNSRYGRMPLAPPHPACLRESISSRFRCA